MSSIPKFKIGELEAKFKQGGMGVGVSLSGLASAVANNGGVGTIAGVGIGALKGMFQKSLEENSKKIDSLSSADKRTFIEELYIESNNKALYDEIKTAQSLRNGNGILAVNIMHALSDHKHLVKVSQDAGIELINTGAGAFLDLPKYVNDSTLIGAIISSAKGAKVFCKKWTQYGHPPDEITYEGPLAGGHLGFKKEQLLDKDFIYSAMREELPKIIEAVKPFKTKSGNPIPVFAAGGIFYGGDIRVLNELGVAGAQMGTRFVTTEECDVHNDSKELYIDCSAEDLGIIDSPVGMPGRAIINQFLRDRTNGEPNKFKCYYKCLRSCKQTDAKYCIAEALIDAQQGKFNRGYMFAGINAPRCDEIIPVKTLVERLEQEYRDNITSGTIQ